MLKEFLTYPEHLFLSLNFNHDEDGGNKFLRNNTWRHNLQDLIMNPLDISVLLLGREMNPTQSNT